MPRCHLQRKQLLLRQHVLGGANTHRHRTLPGPERGRPLLPRGSRDAWPAAPADSPGTGSDPAPGKVFPSAEASAGVGRGAGRSSRSLPALVNQAGGGEKRGGGGGGARRLLPAYRRSLKRRRRRRQGSECSAPRRRPGCPAGPATAGGVSGSDGAAPGAAPAAARAFVCECRRGAGSSRSNSCHIICTGCKQPSP